MHSEKLFHDIFTNIPVGLELYNKEGMLLDCNNRNLEIFGVGDKNRIVGLNLFESPNMTRVYMKAFGQAVPVHFI